MVCNIFIPIRKPDEWRQGGIFAGELTIKT
jgi:hypothetical protein